MPWDPSSYWIGMASLQALQYLNVSFVATILSVPSCPIEAVGESMKSFEQRRWWNDYEGEDNNDNGDDGDDEGNDKEERGWAEGGSWHGASLVSVCELVALTERGITKFSTFVWLSDTYLTCLSKWLVPLWKLDPGGKRLLEFPAVEQGAMAKLVEASSVIAGIFRDPPFLWI
jgi:hypothetical protein